jgi:CelD/BcsL family acetyltransferase involved in cellulose biosynthesis
MVRSPRSLQVRLLTTTDAWDALEPQWRQLFQASSRPATALRWEWLRTWWDVYGPKYAAGRDALRIITVFRGDQLTAALPLYLARHASFPLQATCLRFLSSGEDEAEETCADYLDLLCLPGCEEECLAAIAPALAGLEWDYLDLPEVSAGSPLLRLAGHGLAAKVESRGVCPTADLSGGMDAYLGRLSSRTRQHARQYLRAAERHGFVLDIADEAQANGFFQDLIDLHQARWTAAGRPGCFAARRFHKFHEHLTQRLLPSGEVILARLSHQDQPIALLYGFVTAGKFDFYQSGTTIQPPETLKSPGVTCQLLLMARLIERHVHTYDFLRGSSFYKERLATGQTPMFRIHATRSNLRTLTGAATRMVRGAARRVRRALFPPKAAATALTQ